MNQATRTLIIVFGAVLAGAALLLVGVFVGRSAWAFTGPWARSIVGENDLSTAPGFGGPGSVYQMGPGMMGALGQGQLSEPGYAYGMMGTGGMGSGLMGGGMMEGLVSGGLIEATPLSMDEAEHAVQDYLDRLNNNDLDISEIMIFDNHAYAQIVEKSTGIGAMEVLIDPVTKAVYPEHGPNMMWNLKYSTMSGYGMMGMMDGRTLFTPPEVSAEMPVSPEQAAEAAQDYLDRYLPGAEADDHADAFYGYYTLHILRDGNVVGMLSVNGFTRQVFPHTWHGEFLEMAESRHD